MNVMGVDPRSAYVESQLRQKRAQKVEIAAFGIIYDLLNDHEAKYIFPNREFEADVMRRVEEILEHTRG